MEIADFDWDKFEAEGKVLEQRMRAVVAEMNRQNAESRRSRLSGGHSLAREQPTPDNAWEGRFDRFERMLIETLNAVTVLQHDVSALQRDVGAIREQMATKVELEALRDSINIVAGGFAQTRTRLEHASGLFGAIPDELSRALISARERGLVQQRADSSSASVALNCASS